MPIEMYTKNDCQWCEKASDLISKTIGKGRVTIVYNLNTRKEHKENLLKRYPEAKTVPQIFIDGKHIGGYDDLVEYIDNVTSLG